MNCHKVPDPALDICSPRNSFAPCTRPIFPESLMMDPPALHFSLLRKTEIEGISRSAFQALPRGMSWVVGGGTPIFEWVVRSSISQFRRGRVGAEWSFALSYVGQCIFGCFGACVFRPILPRFHQYWTGKGQRRLEWEYCDSRRWEIALIYIALITSFFWPKHSQLPWHIITYLLLFQNPKI